MYKSFLLGSVLSVAAFQPTALSQEIGSDVETLFVEGQRRAYQGNFDDLETPAAAQTIDLELIREVGALDLNQVLDLSASVARQNNFGGLWNSFSIRGFSGDINLPSGFLVNGFNAGRGFAGPRDIVGIESVEVLKGPRSALFGRGEPGGTVNLVTKRPTFETAGDFRATYGRWQQIRLEGDVQSAFGPDEQVGIRLVGFFEDAESFRETVETQKFGFYPSVTWKAGENTSLTYELEYTEQDVPFDRGVVFAEPFGFSPRETFTGEPGDGPIETRVLGHQFEAQHNFSESWSLLAGVGYRDTSFEGRASENNFGSATEDGVSGRQTYFLDGETISRFIRDRDFDSEYFVIRAELAGEFNTGGLRHRLQIGADFDRFENSLFILRYRPPFFGTGTDVADLDPNAYLSINAFNPVYGQYDDIDFPLSDNTDREEVLKGFGIYIQDQIDITDKLQVRIGGRFDDFEQNLTNLRADTVVQQSDSRFSPQVGVVYRVNDGLSLYGTYGEGFRQQTGQNFQGDQFDPNLTRSAEIGVKADLETFFDDITGSVTLTGFRVSQSNILVNDDREFVEGFFSIDAGKARSLGVELDVNASFPGEINFWFSYAFTDAQATTTNPDPDGFGFTIEAGDPLINAPRHQLTIQASKGFEVAEVPAQVGGGVLYTGERLGFVGTDFFLPSYTTVRLFAQAEPIEGLTLRVDIDNLFDETFYTNSFADVWVQPGAPRAYRFTAAFRF